MKWDEGTKVPGVKEGKEPLPHFGIDTVQGQAPNVTFVRLNAVLQRSGLSRATLYRKISDGTFPRQIRLSSRAVGWRNDDIDTWCRDPVAYCTKR